MAYSEYSDMYQCRSGQTSHGVYESAFLMFTKFTKCCSPNSTSSRLLQTAAALLMNWKNTSNSTKSFLKARSPAQRLQSRTAAKRQIKNGCNQRTMLPSRPVPNEAAANYEFPKTIDELRLWFGIYFFASVRRNADCKRSRSNGKSEFGVQV